MKTITRLLFTAILILPLFLSAGIVNEKLAKTVALNFYSERANLANPSQKMDLAITSTQVISEQGTPLFYSFSVNNDQGFILIAATDQVVPVLGYSFEGSYHSENQPASVQAWIDSYKEQILQAIQNQIPADEYATIQWGKYSVNGYVPEASILSVNPLLTTSWDQGCHFNTLCPVAAGGDCNHAWAGCVATAMAMVMKYHNYPAQGVGSHSYSHPTYGNLSADFGNTTYNWGSMPNVLYSNNTSVATLLYHCGISVNMDYGPDGSGAYTTDVRTALVDYFSYSTAAQYVQRLWYSATGWDNLLKADLDAQEPIVYSGNDPSFGHCFVFDGYQGTNHFHINWGWSGWNNGYFYCDNLNSGNGNFTNNQAAVVHIAPGVGPLANFNASSTEFCAETTIQFLDNSAGSPTSWNWLFPGGNPSSSSQQNPYVTYTLGGNYDVTLTVSDGTNTHTVTKNAYINAKTKPYGNFPDDTTLCCNHAIILDAGNAGAAYAWSTGVFTQTTTVDSTGVGVGDKWEYVDIMTTEGCWNKDSIHIYFAACYGIEEHPSQKLALFPNPSNGLVTLTLGQTANDKAILKVYSSQGMLLREEELPANAGNQQIDLGNLSKGLYLLKLEQGKENSQSRLILY